MSSSKRTAVKLIALALVAAVLGAALRGALFTTQEAPPRVVVEQEVGLEAYPGRYKPIQFMQYSKQGRWDEWDVPPDAFSQPYSPALSAGSERVGQWSVLAVGDIMAHADLQLGAAVHKDEPSEAAGGYDWLFTKVAGLFSGADLVLGNLETPVAPAVPRSGFPLFNVDPQLLDALVHLGFDVLFTANNHSLDQGVAGVIQTQEQLEQRGLLHLGTNHPEAEVRDFLVVPVGEGDVLKLGLVNATFVLNEELSDDRVLHYIAPDADRVGQIGRAVSAARQAGAEYVIVVLHWGREYHKNPMKLQRETARGLCLQGADMVLGAGPHVIQPMETIYSRDGRLLDSPEQGAREHFVAYSMGNFISHQGGMSQYGMALEFVLAAGGGRVVVQDVVPHVLKSVARRGELESRGLVRAHDSYQLEQVPLAEFLDYISYPGSR